MQDEVIIKSVAVPDRSGAFSVSLRDGVVGTIRPAEPASESAWLALPGFANLHAHADRAYTVQSFRPRSFADALAAAASARTGFTAVDVEARAMRLFDRSVAHGVKRIRTHTDVDPVVELRSMEGILAAKRRVAASIDVEIVAFSSSRNDLAESTALARLERRSAARARGAARSCRARRPPRGYSSRRASRAGQDAHRARGRRSDRAPPAGPCHAEPPLRARRARGQGRGRAHRQARPCRDRRRRAARYQSFSAGAGPDDPGQARHHQGARTFDCRREGAARDRQYLRLVLSVRRRGHAGD